MSDPTNFVESNFLLAVLMGDLDGARTIACDKMLPGERTALFEAMEDALDILDWIDP